MPSRDNYSTATEIVTLLQVTGANQGIGLEIVRQLCRKFDGRVLLAGAPVALIKTKSAALSILMEGIKDRFKATPSCTLYSDPPKS